MDHHQQAMWQRMTSEVESCRSGEIDLATLVRNLRGLYVEADPHDQEKRDEFELRWSRLDAENELRTEPWAPPGSASDEILERLLIEFVVWVEALVAADPSSEHN